MKYYWKHTYVDLDKKISFLCGTNPLAIAFAYIFFFFCKRCSFLGFLTTEPEHVITELNAKEEEEEEMEFTATEKMDRQMMQLIEAQRAKSGLQLMSQVGMCCFLQIVGFLPKLKQWAKVRSVCKEWLSRSRGKQWIRLLHPHLRDHYNKDLSENLNQMFQFTEFHYFTLDFITVNRAFYDRNENNTEAFRRSCELLGKLATFLPNLQTLVFKNCYFYPTKPRPQFENLSAVCFDALRSLTVEMDWKSYCDLSFLPMMPNLNSVTLFTSDAPSEWTKHKISLTNFQHLHHLKHLKIHNLRLHDSLSNVSTNIQALHLSNCYRKNISAPTKDDFINISNLHKLKVLKLNSVIVTFDFLHSLSELMILDLQECVQTVRPTSMRHLLQLEQVFLGECYMDVESLQILSSLPKLTLVDVSQCSFPDLELNALQMLLTLPVKNRLVFLFNKNTGLFEFIKNGCLTSVDDDGNENVMYMNGKKNYFDDPDFYGSNYFDNGSYNSCRFSEATEDLLF